MDAAPAAHREHASSGSAKQTTGLPTGCAALPWPLRLPRGCGNLHRNLLNITQQLFAGFLFQFIQALFNGALDHRNVLL